VHVGGVQPVALTFNSDGSTSVTDARGTTRVHQFTTTAAGAIKAASIVASCGGCTPISSSLSYDANGFLNGSVDPNGTASSYSFNSRGPETNRAEATNSALARAVSITWHPTFHEPMQITFPDRVISFTYDNVGNRLTKTVTAGATTRTWSYAYNSQGLLTQITGPRTDVAQITSLAYDGSGHLTSVTNPLGQVLKFNGYDANGRPLSITDPNGVTSQLTYDPRGRVISRTASGRTWTFQRDALGQVTAITYPNGSVTHLGYDSAHRLTDATDALGNRRHRTLDAAGEAVQLQLLDPSNNVVRQQSFTFDGYGRIVTTIDANGKSTTLAYDNNGNVVSTTDALAHTRSVVYDALNRPTSATDPLGQITSISYNVFNQPLQVTAANGAVTQFSYDSFWQTVQEISPDRGASTIVYSNAGLPLSRTDARGVTASISYDVANRPTKINYTGAPGLGLIGLWLQSLGTSIVSDNVSFTYDQGTGCSYGVGRLCSRSDQTGTERFGYDPFGNVVQQVDVQLGFTYTTQYAFDAANQLTQMTYPDGRVINYTTDALERITEIAATVNHVSASVLSSVQYGADGSLLGMSFGNGLAESRTYDPVGRMVSQLLGTVDNRSHAFDAIGNLTGKQTSAESDQFSYDGLNRLTGEQRAVGSTTASNVFGYDPNGNRLSETTNGATTLLGYTPNSNRLVQFGASPITFDNAGNTTSDLGGVRKFYYSAAGHLQWISQNGIPIAGYLYNGLGQRTGKLTLQGISLYHYDIVGRLIGETTIGSQPSRDYVWAGSTPVAQINHWVPIGAMLQMAHCSAGADGKIDWMTYLHTDGLGTPRIGTDVQQNVVWRWDGEAFGETAPTQSVPAGAYPVYVNLRNPGQYVDQESGLFDNGARYYNPLVGRYLSSDPVGLAAGLSTFVYADDSPTNRVDPAGLATYIITTYDNYLGFWIASHSALFSSTPGVAQFLYDPAGSYQNSTRGTGGFFEGPLLPDYVLYQLSTGSRVEITPLNTSAAEEQSIIQSAIDLGDPRGLSCASSVSAVLGGACGIGTTSFPGTLYSRAQGSSCANH
jgi:RHS repeat-associated protein